MHVRAWQALEHAWMQSVEDADLQDLLAQSLPSEVVQRRRGMQVMRKNARLRNATTTVIATQRLASDGKRAAEEPHPVGAECRRDAVGLRCPQACVLRRVFQQAVIGPPVD